MILGKVYQKKGKFVTELSKSQNSHFRVAYVVRGTRFRAPRARRARVVRLFFMDQFFLPRRLTYFKGPSLKTVFWGSLCSKWNAFSCAAGAPCARREIFFHGSISFAKAVNLF